ncbi:hypothetical protein BC835DRAFT_1370284 [Cytidiella melzeri]|nr:hypothetical protein BC835DRAFT_1370284 [Cytidiella melzeri]
MGNASSSGRSHQDDTVDFGYLTPQGVYTGPRDWNQNIVTQLIVDRKLAPFYRPLEEYEEDWDDEQILAHMKEPQQPESTDADSSSTRVDAASIVSSSSRTHHKRHSGSSKEACKEQPKQPELGIYHGAAECPICFLYYPANINHSRCCEQAICTECFVQIKRADPTTTHLVSEHATCPYCVQENFGVVYTPPSWRTGIGSEGWPPPVLSDLSKNNTTSSNPTEALKTRRKSFGADAPEVVTIDQIRPDWEAKLAAVRATVARRANRRIVMRQVGDRLIPIGITSGRVHALPTEEVPAEQAEGSGGGADRGSRRSRRRQPNQELNQILGQMGLGGQDLEELMIMEAMRLSMIDHEEQQRKQKEEEEKQKKEASNSAASKVAENPSSSSTALPESTSSTSAVPSPPLLSPSSPAKSITGSATTPRTSATFSRSSLDLPAIRRSPSPRPMGALEAALRSATSAASALATPAPDREEELNTSQSQVVLPAAATDETPAAEASATVSSSSEPAVSDSVTPTVAGFATPLQPLAVRSQSFASSVLSEDTENETSH